MEIWFSYMTLRVLDGCIYSSVRNFTFEYVKNAGIRHTGLGIFLNGYIKRSTVACKLNV